MTMEVHAPTIRIPKSGKTSISLPLALWEKLAWLGQRLNLTQIAVIREALEVRYRLQKEIDDGGEIMIKRSNGDQVTIWLTGSSA